MMAELWMRKTDKGDEDENNVEDMSRFQKSGVQLAWLDWENLVSVLLHAGSGLVPTVLGMVNWLAYKISWSSCFWLWFLPSVLFLLLNTTITLEHEVGLSLAIFPRHDQELTPSTAYSQYSIHRVQVILTVPGYPASVWVGTRTATLVRVRNCHRTQPGQS